MESWPGFGLGLESDEEIRRVPVFGAEPAGPSTSGRETGSGAGPDRAKSSAPAGQRKRGRSPADKEHKRLKRYGNMVEERAHNFANLPIILYLPNRGISGTMSLL